MTAGIFFRWPCEAGEVVFLLLTVAAVAAVATSRMNGGFAIRADKTLKMSVGENFVAAFTILFIRGDRSYRERWTVLF